MMRARNRGGRAALDQPASQELQGTLQAACCMLHAETRTEQRWPGSARPTGVGECPQRPFEHEPGRPQARRQRHRVLLALVPGIPRHTPGRGERRPPLILFARPTGALVGATKRAKPRNYKGCGFLCSLLIYYGRKAGRLGVLFLYPNAAAVVPLLARLALHHEACKATTPNT